MTQTNSITLANKIEKICSILHDMTSDITPENHNEYTSRIVQLFAQALALKSYISDSLKYQDLPDKVQFSIVTNNIALTIASHIIAKIDHRKPTPEKVYEYLCGCAYTETSEFTKEEIKEMMVKLDNELDVVLQEIKNTKVVSTNVSTTEDIIRLVNDAIISVDNNKYNNN